MPDLLGSGVVVAIGAFLLIWSPRYELRQHGHVIGPGFVPFWFGVAMLIFGLSTASGVFVKAVKSAKGAQSEPTGGLASDGPKLSDDAEAGPDETAGPAGHSVWKRTTLVFALAVAAAALTPALGILVAFGLLTLTVLLGVERRRWWVSLIVSAVSIVCVALLFGSFLNIPLPIGPWGF